jgi:hypothetical protein
MNWNVIKRLVKDTQYIVWTRYAGCDVICDTTRDRYTIYSMDEICWVWRHMWHHTWYSDNSLGMCVCNSKLQQTRCNVFWFIYFYRRCTCFRRFLRPSSGAHNCTDSFRYCQPILLLAATVEEMEPSSIFSTVDCVDVDCEVCIARLTVYIYTIYIVQFQLIRDTSRQQLGWILPDTVNIDKCSWWWAKTSPETCRADLE